MNKEKCKFFESFSDEDLTDNRLQLSYINY